jgi:hypothetical protein
MKVILPNILDSNSNLDKSMTHHNQTKELTIWFLNFMLNFLSRFEIFFLVHILLELFYE